jgi:hypothetical protein
LEGAPQGLQSDDAQTRMAFAEDIFSGLMDALIDSDTVVSEVRVSRLTEGAYRLDIVEWGGDHQAATYTWDGGEVVETEPPAPFNPTATA